MFLHAQSVISRCWMDSFHLEIGIQTKYWVKKAPLKSSPGEKCLNLERYCSAVYYSDTFWPAHVKFNDKGLFFLTFLHHCVGEGKKVCFSLIDESAGNKHRTNREGHVCALMPDGIMRHGFFLFENQWRKLAFISVEWRGFSFQTWELFFGIRRSKDPHTDQRETTLDSTAAPVETINVCNSSAITLVNWNVLSFCVLCILGQRRSLSFILKHHF